MKRLNKLLLLLGVLAVVVVATVFVLHSEEKKEQIRNTDEVILAVPAETVTALAWQYDETVLAFHKADAWQWDEDAAFPVDEEKLGELLSVFENFGAAFVIEDVDDFGQYGLEDPTCTIRITADGTEHKVLLGAFSAMDSQRYVSVGDGNVYLVRTDPFDSYELTAGELLRNDEAPDFDTVNAVRFSGAENYEIRRDEDSTRSDCESDVYFTENGSRPLDTFRVEDYCGSISLLGLTEDVSYNVTAEELTAWGLDAPELSVTVDYTVSDKENGDHDESFTLHIGRNREELAAKAAAEAEQKNYTGSVTCYARVGESPIVYRITQKEYDTLRAAAFNDLRHREVLTAGFDAVTGVKVTLEGETYTLTSALPEDDKDGDRVWSFGGEEIDIAALKSKITALSVDSFTSEAPEGREEIRMTFTLDNEHHPETAVALYRYDGASCLVIINGENVGLVSRTDAVALVEAVNAIVLG